jgi:hypothetical protein
MDWPEPNNFNRCARKAELLTMAPPASRRPLLPALFDPVLIRANESGMFLQGWEIHTEGDEVLDTVQTWWVKFAPL